MSGDSLSLPLSLVAAFTSQALEMEVFESIKISRRVISAEGVDV